MTAIIQISCLVWMLIIYSGHEMCVNARDLCTHTLQITGKIGGRELSGGEKGGGSQCVTPRVVECFLINTQLCLQTL